VKVQEDLGFEGLEELEVYTNIARTLVRIITNIKLFKFVIYFSLLPHSSAFQLRRIITGWSLFPISSIMSYFVIFKCHFL
jgi:hypothetical protein